MLIRSSKIGFGVITQAVWLCYESLSPNQHGMGEISCSIQVCTKRFNTTMARKTTRQSGTKLTASMADLGSVVRLDPDNFNSLSFSFVFDKTLQLVERPIAYPVVHPLSSSLLPYSLQIFHHNLVSIERGNNPFANVVVYPSHVTCFSSANFSKQPLRGTSAFGLKLASDELDFSFDLLNFRRIVKPAVRSDSKVVYSEVDAKNSMRIRAFSINLFGKSEHEEASLLPVNSQKAFLDLPSDEIILVAGRDADVDFLHSFNCLESENISLEPSTSWEVVADGSFFDYGLCLGFLDNAASLPDTGNYQLRWQGFSQIFIDEMVQSEVVLDFMFPSSVDAELHSLLIDGDGFDYNRVGLNFDFCTCPDSHNVNVEQDIFKLIGGTGFLSCLKTGVSALRVL